MVIEYKVVWDKEALNQLKAAYLFIRRDSLQNAEKVKNDILLKTAALKNNPTKYAADKQ